MTMAMATRVQWTTMTVILEMAGNEDGSRSMAMVGVVGTDGDDDKVVGRCKKQICDGSAAMEQI